MSTYDSTLDIYIGYYGGRRPDAEGLFSEFTSTGNANPTGRVLSGSSDHGYAEEWEEPGTFRGAKCVCIFLFSADETGHENAEDYPWDADHAHRIILSDSNSDEAVAAATKHTTA